MIKLVAVGVWAIVVTVGAAFGAIELGLVQSMLQGKVKLTAQTGTLNTPTLSVPIMQGGTVVGYILAKFAVTITLEPGASSSGRLEDLVADEAFKVIFQQSAEEISDARKPALTALTKAIQDGINAREKKDRVQDVLIKEWSYLKKEDARR
ncbi:MAG: hypothetical protein ABL908_00320 [Hyphomicrobium sp.]